MASFTDRFPDSSILSMLGDDIEHTPEGGEQETIKGEFEFKYLEDELGDRIDIVYPTVDMNTADTHTITAASVIVAFGKTYRLLKKRPSGQGKTMLILRAP